jgi:MoxR-like ATPase
VTFDRIDGPEVSEVAVVGSGLKWMSAAQLGLARRIVMIRTEPQITGGRRTTRDVHPRTSAVPDQAIQRLRDNITSVFLGHPKTVDLVLIGLLARGHVLIEDVPGVGKTVLAKALAKSIDCNFSRIQLTPDLLPGDVLGVSVYNSKEQNFEFKPGPIFANIVLADEINRTTPRTQSALLEAMSEEQVSIENQTRKLERPFMVVATQNPFEFEGTYYLPENQLDRFLVRANVGYPPRDAEQKIITMQPGRNALDQLKPVLTAADVIRLQDHVPNTKMNPAIVDYLLDLVDATRRHEQLHLGVSTRGALALTAASQASAVLDGRDYVQPDDVKNMFLPACAHRVISKSYLNNGDNKTTGRILQTILDTIPTPR